MRPGQGWIVASTRVVSIPMVSNPCRRVLRQVGDKIAWPRRTRLTKSSCVALRLGKKGWKKSTPFYLTKSLKGCNFYSRTLTVQN
jgi:hypothetical protein